jgi:hypothetical protein
MNVCGAIDLSHPALAYKAVQAVTPVENHPDQGIIIHKLAPVIQTKGDTAWVCRAA